MSYVKYLRDVLGEGFKMSAGIKKLGLLKYPAVIGVDEEGDGLNRRFSYGQRIRQHEPLLMAGVGGEKEDARMVG